MSQKWKHAHASSTSLLISGASLFVLAETKPAAPESTTKARVVIEGTADEVVLTPAERTVNIDSRTVEHSVHILKVPITVEVNRLWCIDGFQAMLKSAGCGPHLGEHGVAVLPSLFVHDVHQTFGKPGDCDDGAATGRRGHLEIVTSCIQTEDPVGLAGVEDWIKSDKISFFADSPLEIVLLVRHGRSCVGRRGCKTIVLESWRAPYRCLAILAGFVFDHVGEVLIGTVKFRYPESLGPLPHSFTRLLAGPVTNSGVEFVVVSIIAKIHFPIPVEVVVGVLLAEPLQSKVSRAIDTMNTLARGVLERLSERRRVVVEQLRFGPENSHVPELLRHILFNDLLVDTLVGPDRKSLILDVQKEPDVILTARLERELSNHSAKRVQLVVVEIVTSPDTKDIGVTGDLTMSVLVLETSFVLVVALLHSLAPVDVGVVDCAHLLKELVSADVLRVETRAETTSRSIVTIAVRTESTISIIADVVSQTKLFVSTEEGSRHVSGKAWVYINIRNFDLILIVHVTGLDFSMLLGVFIRAVIGIRVQLDGVKGGLLGKATSLVAVNDTLGHGSVVAILRCPVFDRC